MKTLSSIIALLLTVAFAETAVAAGCDPPDWTVSQILKADRSQFHTPVRVRGVLKAGEHGLYFLDEHCSAVCDQVVKIDTSNVDHSAAKSEGLDAQLSGLHLHDESRRYIATVQVEVVYITPPVTPGRMESKPRISSLKLIKLDSLRP